jgi:phospholipid/cholesterol/gamma-HCH transport system ATP-binding protein
VLQGIDLEVRPGEVVAIVGGSGSGKTVLLHCLTALLAYDEGSVLVADHSRPDAPLVDLARLAPEELDAVRLAWSVVFQRNALFGDTVYENCALWLRNHTSLSEPEIGDRIRRGLAAAGLRVEDVLFKQRDELSGGMAKRVAVVRALVSDPVVLFYDEPTTGLDPVNAAHLHDLIWETHRQTPASGARRTSVIVTHDRDLLRRLAPRVVMLHDGRACFDGTYEDFGSSAIAPVQEYLRTMPALHARDPGGASPAPSPVGRGVSP